MLRIHDILVWIRIRRSMPLTNGSGSGFGSRSCYFCPWPSRQQQKITFYKFFLLITFWRDIYIIFQRQKVNKKSQNSRNQGFSYYFAWWQKDLDPDPGGLSMEYSETSLGHKQREDSSYKDYILSYTDERECTAVYGMVWQQSPYRRIHPHWKKAYGCMLLFWFLPGSQPERREE